MSIDILTTVSRQGTPLGIPPILCQLDLMSQQEAAAYGGGEAPYFRYNAFTINFVTLLQGDQLTDTANYDPTTGALKRYLIIGEPELFPDGHTEFVCDRLIGKSS